MIMHRHAYMVLGKEVRDMAETTPCCCSCGEATIKFEKTKDGKGIVIRLECKESNETEGKPAGAAGGQSDCCK